MKKLYKENKDDPLRPKNMPENSGKIAWARSIITRIKKDSGANSTRVSFNLRNFRSLVEFGRGRLLW